MKKRLVAVVLSMTMCLATAFETGAAAFTSPDGVDAVFEQETEDMEELPEEELPREDAGETDSDIFSDGEILEEITDELPEELPELEEADAFSAGEDAADTAAADPANGIPVSAEDWEPAPDGKFRLRKPEGLRTAEAAETQDAEITDPAEETVVEAAEAAEPEYFTAADGIVCITTEYKEVKHTGNYLFDAEGNLITGRYSFDNGGEFFGRDKATAEIYPDFKGTDKEINPCSSNLGQQILNDWGWTGTAFRFYDENGKFVSMKDLDTIYKNTGKYTGYYKINGDYYCLRSDGTPRTGNVKITIGSAYSEYYFQTAAETNSVIPGKMFRNGWRVMKGSNGKDRWLYYNQGGTRPSDVGKLYRRGTVATKLDPKVSSSVESGKTYLIDKYGYILKSTMRKAENGAYYSTDSRGVIYRDKLVRYKGVRYYFGKDGKRVSWKNSWMRCPGASDRYYYFGSTPGRIEEKTGWQRVYYTNGKFNGWYYFSSGGNHYMNAMTSSGYYFTKYGRVASGLTEVNGKKYIFEASDENTHRGKMYKNTLVYYKDRYYYASENGALRKTGWQSTNGNWYYFDNYRAVTNKFMKKNGVNGYLDSTGKYTTGWVIVSNTNNQVRYIDPDGDGFVKNDTETINGLLYYFDSNGYRINDLTHIYGGPYAVDVDRVNGLMTVYNSARTVPVKSIRVSVGNSWTATPTGWYTLRRSLRWQPLMGPSWGQYGTHVQGAGQGGIFVHSVSGSQPNSYSLPGGEYNKLGNPASHGCIRACVADAKWVYDNCNGASIHIYDGSYNANESMKGPLGRRALVPLRYPYNFDPTDPAI